MKKAKRAAKKNPRKLAPRNKWIAAKKVRVRTTSKGPVLEIKR